MHERAVLYARKNPADWNFLSRKKTKEMARLRRRLGEKGEVVYRQAREPAAVRLATEAFLTLEHEGWKGKRKTALLASPARASFVREMTRSMAEAGKCRIDTLEVEDNPIAIGIILQMGSRAYFWKTVYDETFAAFSPGVLLTLELTRAQLSDPNIAMSDSCAIPDHPMIDRLWRDRMSLVDVVVTISESNARLQEVVFAAILRGDAGYRAVRAVIKSMLYKFTRRWRS
jgi:hypothetical protein